MGCCLQLFSYNKQLDSNFVNSQNNKINNKVHPIQDEQNVDPILVDQQVNKNQTQHQINNNKDQQQKPNQNNINNNNVIISRIQIYIDNNHFNQQNIKKKQQQGQQIKKEQSIKDEDLNNSEYIRNQLSSVQIRTQQWVNSQEQQGTADYDKAKHNIFDNEPLIFQTQSQNLFRTNRSFASAGEQKLNNLDIINLQNNKKVKGNQILINQSSQCQQLDINLINNIAEKEDQLLIESLIKLQKEKKFIESSKLIQVTPGKLQAIIQI